MFLPFAQILDEFLFQFVQQLLEIRLNVVDLGVEERRPVDHNRVWVDGIFELPVRKKTFSNVCLLSSAFCPDVKHWLVCQNDS